ncbi:MAG: uroporphyrinogen decarboxylase family protein [Anaerolineae bacterium]|jgi:hypothetical protein|nr:uroporphyrinogen decarboxylase family protein [Anaerolineae bacterium]
MSRNDGLAAMNLKMPKRIPRTEYSVERHWEVVRAVTGLQVNGHSSPEEQSQASIALKKAWNFDFQWATQIGRAFLGGCYTEMGHAEYEADGSDFVAIGERLFQNTADIFRFDPFECLPNPSVESLTEYFNQAYQHSQDTLPDCVHTVGTYITQISGYIDLFGWEDMLMALGEDQNAFGNMTFRYADWMMKYYEALAQCDAPFVLIHDDIVWSQGPFISPRWYRKYVFPHYERYLDPLKKAGKKVLFCSDGGFNVFVDDLVAVGMDGFIFEPFTSLENIAEKYGQTHVIIGNADTRILLMGTTEEIHKEVERCMSIGRDCPGYFMAVGNHIPSNTPVENVLYYNQIYEELSSSLRK